MRHIEPLTSLLCASALCGILPAASLAQSGVGSVSGTVFDSLTSRPIAGALVEVAGSERMVTADAQGRFRIDSLAAGPQRLSFSATHLDSIGLFGFARDVIVRAGTSTQLVLATPSFRTLHERLCGPSEKPTADSAIVFGTVYDARSGARLDGARVSFAWFAVGKGAQGLQIEEASRVVTSGESGDYGVCGLPDDLALSTRATLGDASSGRITNAVGEARVLRRDLFISNEFRVEASSESSGAATGTTSGAIIVDSARLPVRGSGVVRGTVRDERGNALMKALVVLPAVDLAVRTDSTGRFVFTGVPVGTQELSVRQVGLGAIYRVVDVRGDQPVDVRLELPQSTVLATVNVRGERRYGADRMGYLNRKRLGFGQFIDQKEIATRFDMESALRRVNGLVVSRSMSGLDIRARRPGCNGTAIVIDGVPSAKSGGGSTIPLDGGQGTPMMSFPEMRVDGLSPRDVVAMEYYSASGPAPLEYSSGFELKCGMLLIWTVFARW